MFSSYVEENKLFPLKQPVNAVFREIILHINRNIFDYECIMKKLDNIKYYWIIFTSYVLRVNYFNQQNFGRNLHVLIRSKKEVEVILVHIAYTVFTYTVFKDFKITFSIIINNSQNLQLFKEH
jgi:hypothetical protein